MRELFIAIGIMVLSVVVLWGIILGVYSLADKMACKEFAAINSGYEFRWDLLTGCKMKTPQGFWIDTDALRYSNGKIVFENE